VGVAGEVYVGGAGVARGYLKRPELTLEKFVVDPFSRQPGARLYRTGDLARFLPNGEIQYLGRNDDQVKIRGFRIELGEIESALRDHPTVRDCVVIPMPHDAEKRLAAYVVLRERLEPSIADLRAFLRVRLANYMVPSWFVFLDKLPLTANGKVNRRVLPPTPTVPFEAPVDYVAPSNQLEETIAHVWESVLGQPKVGTHGNFFDLGGTSLMIVQVHLRLQDLLQHELPISALFQFPTVSALACHLDGEAAAERRPSDQAQVRAAKQREALGRRRPVGRS
jgi:acyl carrier protein